MLGWGWLREYSDGIILYAEEKMFTGVFSPYRAELFAIRTGIYAAIRMGWTRIIIESDCLQAINDIQKFHPFAMDAPVLDLIRHCVSRLEIVSFTHCLRLANQAAHDLARRCFHSRISCVWMLRYLCILKNL